MLDGGHNSDKNVVIEEAFGSIIDPLSKEEKFIRCFTFMNKDKMVVRVITYGATIINMKVPDKNHQIADVVLGFDNIEGYLEQRNAPKGYPYIGATIGRVGNRIGGACFCLDGEKIKVTANLNGKHMLHGGRIGFDSVVWMIETVSSQDCFVRLRHVSPHGDEGFPGDLTVTVDFQLKENNEFHVKFCATTNRPTPVNMTNHSYFNLAGHDAGSEGLYRHHIEINADKILETDDDSIPTGEFLDVALTPLDFRRETHLGDRIAAHAPQGFDNNYCLKPTHPGVLKLAATAVDMGSGRKLELFSDQPGVQFYTANFLPDPKLADPPLIGKNGTQYTRQGAFCFEPQGYPDAVNHPNFPSVILRPDDSYEHTLVYKFSAT